jgi:hypothetical protein
MHPARPTRRRRRKQWWKAFASPKWMLMAVPFLLMPLCALALLPPEEIPSPIETAIQALPSAGGVADIDVSKTPASPLGAGPRLSSSVSLPLYANSAHSQAVVLALRQANRAAKSTDGDVFSTEYALLHPPSLSKEDLLIGDLALVSSTPLTMDLSVKIFEEYCNAQVGDAFYDLPIEALPIDPLLRQSLARFANMSDKGGSFCSRLGRDDVYYADGL